MKPTQLRKILNKNKEKLPLIDRITDLHPGYGTELGWSRYVGGMVDDGDWILERLLEASYYQLESFLKQREYEDEQAKIRQDEWDKLTQEEKIRKEKEAWEEIKNKFETQLMWGKVK